MVHSRPSMVAALVAALASFPPGGAAAGPADPRFSSVEPVILGTPSGAGYASHATGATQAARGFWVNVRDVNNAPESGDAVTLSFGGTNVRLYTSQQSGVSVNCVARTLTGTTDGNGSVTFFPRFGGASNSAVVSVDSRGVILANVRARSTDLDALDGRTGLGDLALFSSFLLTDPQNHPEADFDLSGGTLGLGDFVIFSAEMLGGAQGTYCP